METILSAQEEMLVPGLRFEMGHTADYVTSRKMSSYFPSGSSTLSPQSGAKVLRVVLGDNVWIDPSTLKVEYQFNPVGANMTPISPHGAFCFTRMRILAGGQVVEQIDHYNRTCEMYSRLLPHNTKASDADIEGFGLEDAGKVLGAPNIANANFNSNVSTVPNGSSKTVQFTPLSGLVQQGRFLPLMLMGNLTLEFELVGAKQDCIQEDIAAHTWSLTFPKVSVDTLTLSANVQEDFLRSIEAKPLDLQMSTFISMAQQINGPSARISFSRAVTELKGVWCTLWGRIIATANAAQPPAANKVDSAESLAMQRKLPEGSAFLHPANPELTVQIGSHRWPDFPLNNTPAFYNALKKSIGLHAIRDGMDLSKASYEGSCFIAGIDLERLMHVTKSGISLRAGESLQLDWKNLTTDGTTLAGTDPSNLSMAYVVMEVGQVVRIGIGGLEVLD